MIGCWLFCSASALAQCVKGDCFTGHGTYIFPDKSRYVGYFKRGVIEGRGIYYDHGGDKYLGGWKNSQRHGEGKWISKTGESYIGTFHQGKIHGSGKFTYADGRYVEGQWNENLPVGEAEMFYPDGRSELGSWENGRWKSKEPIAVSYRKPTPELKEEVKKRPTNKNCNKLHCHKEEGVFVYKDGSKYTGWFVNGQPEGKGKCVYASGDEYVGFWKNHSPHGEGIMYFQAGRVYGAEWEYGTPVKELEARQSTELMKDVLTEYSEEQKVWAVVIGVSRYNHMPVLNYCDDDAYRFYAFLKSPEGGALPDEQITLLIDEDATRKNIIDQMQKTVLRADENDVVMVYFSGHGLQGSFVPIDYDGYNNKLSYDDFTHILDQSKAEYKMCFADACHSGSLMAQKSVEETIDLYYGAFDNVEAGTAFMLSSKAEEFSLEDGGLRQGIFSHYLIKGIQGHADQDRNKVITIGELYNYVRFEVRRYSGNIQTPMMVGQYDKNMPVGVVR